MTAITASALYARCSRVLRSRTGTIGTVTPVTDGGILYLDIVLNGLINTKGDPSFVAGDVLFLPDSAEGSKEALIKSWTDLTGTARIIAQAATPIAGDDYVVWNREDFTLYEYRQALEKAQSYSRRSYRQVIPLTPNLALYPLYQMDWLRGAGDINAAWLSTSPVLLHNEDMALWQNGPNLAPDGYTLTDLGTGATITRQLGGMRSAYKAHIEAGSGIVRFTQPIPDSLVAWASGRTQTAPVRWPMRPWAWVSTPDADSVRCFVFDGATYHYTDYFTATTTGVPEFQETSLVPSNTDTAYTWGVEIAAGAEADVHVAGEVQNTQTVTLTYVLKQQGSQGFPETLIPLNKRNVGGLVEIELPNWPGAWYQLIVHALRDYPTRLSDDDAIDEQYAAALQAGTLRYLLEPIGPTDERAGRFDRILGEQSKIWSRFMTDQVDKPAPTPLVQANIWGA